MADPPIPSGSPLRNVTADIELEAQIRAAARKPREVPPLVEGAFVLVTLLSAFCIGLIFGWGPFSKLLEAEGVYADRCVEGEELPCDSQTIFYAALYTFGTCALSFGGLPAGVLLDSYGPSLAAMVAGGMIGTGLLLFALLPAQGTPYAFIAPFVCLGTGGIVTALTAFKSAGVFPRSASMLMTAVNVIFDISATVPLITYELYHRLGLSRATIFTPYALYVYGLFGAWGVLWRRLEWRLNAPQEESGAKEEASASAGAHGASSAAPVAVEPITPLDSPQIELRTVLTSPQFVVGLLWFNIHQFRSNMYLGTAKDMLRSLGDADGRYMELLTASLAAAVPFIPLISTTTDWLGVAGSMQAVTVLATVHAVCALVPSLAFQPLTFLVFAILRASTFSVGSIFAARTFGFARLGTVYGLMQVQLTEEPR